MFHFSKKEIILLLVAIFVIFVASFSIARATVCTYNWTTCYPSYCGANDGCDCGMGYCCTGKCDCYYECTGAGYYWCWGSSANNYYCKSSCAPAGYYAPEAAECCSGLSWNSSTKQCYSAPTCYDSDGYNFNTYGYCSDAYGTYYDFCSGCYAYDYYCSGSYCYSASSYCTYGCSGGKCNSTGKSNGQTCSYGCECTSGYCVDGYCCNWACNGTCMQCNYSGYQGTCVYTPSGQDPANECASGTCRTGNCDGAGACGWPTDDANCGTIDCDGLNYYYQSGTESPTATEYCYYRDYADITSNRCEGLGDCKDANTADCTSYSDGLQYSCGTCKYISAASCTGGTLGSCSNYAFCTSCGSGYICDGSGNCISLKSNGTSCSAGCECSSGYCVDGVCCNSACTGTCVKCNLAGAVGTCSYIPLGEDPDSECSGVSACNGSGACTTCSSLSYPTDRWQRVWYDYEFDCLGNTPDETNTQFDNNWGTGTVAYGKGDYIQFQSSRSINFGTAGTYRFTLGNDDGAELYIDGVLKISDWTSGSYRTHSVDVSLTAGYHNFQINWYEATGSARVSFTYIQLDTTPPTSSITAPAAGSWFINDFSVSVSDSDTGGSGLSTCYYDVYDSGRGYTKTNASRTCNSSFTVTAGSLATNDCNTQGANTCTVYVWATDGAGNVGSKVSRSFSLDYTAPNTPSIDSPAAGSWQKANFSVSVSGDGDTGGSGYTCYYHVYDSVAGWTKSWVTRTCNSSFTVTVGSTADCRTQGSNQCTVYAFAQDGAGNTSSNTTRAFSIDYTAPNTPSITSPAAGSTQNADFPVSVSGDGDTGGSGYTCYYDVYDSGVGYTKTNTTRTCNSSFTVTVGSGKDCRTNGGTCTVYVFATDGAGNTGTKASRSFNIVIPVPPTMVTDPADNITGTTARLWGHIGNDGGASTGARFVWGDTTSYGSASDWTADSYYTGQSFYYDITSLTKGKTYHFRIEGHNSAGYGYGSDTVFTTKPDAPTSFTATAVSSSQINLSWTKGSGAYYTMIRRSTTGYPTSPTDGTQVYYDTGTSYNDTGLTAGTTYYYSAWSRAYEEGYYQYSDSYVTTYAKTFSGVCSPLNYPTTKWQRVWYEYDSTSGTLTNCIGDGPDESGEEFDTDWGTDFVGGYKQDKIGFTSSRSVYFKSAGYYEFCAGSDDGINIWLDKNGDGVFGTGEQIFNRWVNRSYVEECSFNIKIEGAGYHKMRIDYYEDTNDARVSFDLPSKECLGECGSRGYPTWGSGCSDEVAGPMCNTACAQAGYCPGGVIDKYGCGASAYWGPYGTDPHCCCCNYAFELSTSPSSGIVAPSGGSVKTTVTFSRPCDKLGGSDFAASGLPSGASASFSPASCEADWPWITSCSSEMTISTASPVAVGTYTITIDNTRYAGTDKTKPTTYTLTVIYLPDLIITNAWDEAGTVRYAIKNQGDATAGESYTALYIQDTGGNWVYRANDYEASLAAGSSRSGSDQAFPTYTLANRTTDCAGRTTLPISVCADYYGPRVDEKNEDNNCYFTSLTCDTTPPTTTIKCNDTTCKNPTTGWYNADVKITLSCDDGTGGSGCDKTYYCKDQTDSCLPTTEYTGAFYITTEVTNYVRFYSTDKAGNIETPIKSQRVNLDKTPPTTEIK